MLKQMTVTGREGPLQLSVGDRVCVPYNLRRLGSQTVDDIARIADQFTGGEDGVHICYGTAYGTMTIVIRDRYEVGGEDGATVGKVRAVWRGDSGSKQTERRGLPVYRRSLGQQGCEGPIVPYASD